MKKQNLFTSQIKELQTINRCYTENIHHLYSGTPTVDDLNFVNGYLQSALVQAQDILTLAREHIKQNTEYYNQLPQNRPYQIPTAGSAEMEEAHEHLCSITSGLMDMCRVAGRTGYHRNQLLRECYNLVDVELHTIEAWHSLGFSIIPGTRPYMFWDRPIEMEEGRIYNPIQFLFSADQVIKQ